jgi:hypothetical protein
MAEQIDMFRTVSNVEWIKTSDKLPPMEDWVLTVRVFGAGKYRSVGIAYLFDCNAKTDRPKRLFWQYQPIGDQWAAPLDDVTHWAPLPALPEKEG